MRTVEKLMRRPSLCAAIMMSCVQPVIGSQASIPLPLQVGGVPGVQTPDWHVSAPLHRFPSGHGVPSGATPCWQPAMGSQVSTVHGFPSLQLSARPCVQLPFWQVSLPLHTLPSLHDVPFGTAVCLQPATGSHVSVVHAFASSHFSGVPAVQTPA